MYAVILAGGGGTRLWPLSRRDQPKHLHCLCGDGTMIAQTYERICSIIPDDRILVVTVPEQAEEIRAQLPKVPRSNVVVEPVGRNTAPCLGLMATLIAKRDPGAVMAALPADHVVGDADAFRSVLLDAARLAQRGFLVTLGIEPTRAETGYGYIERGLAIESSLQHPAYRVARFTEKPDGLTARRFIESGQYYWNSGMFVWRASALLTEMERLLPNLYLQLDHLRPALGTPLQQAALEDAWLGLDSVSIDYGIMEKAGSVAVIPAQFGWNDVGSWTSVSDVQVADSSGNVLEGEGALLDCQNTYVHSGGRLVAGIGLRDMIIVDTGDTVLVCPKERAQDVKELVERLRAEGRERYL